MTFLSMIPAEAYDVIGIVGFGVYVINYVLLTLKRLSAEHTLYFVLNLVAATLVLFSLAAAFNMASALIQVFWISISIVGILIRLRPARPADQRTSKPLSADTHVRIAAIENQTAPQFVSQRRRVVSLPDASPGIYSLGPGSEKRSLRRAEG